MPNDFVIEPITVANKNVTSFYDKKDVSFLVNEKYKFTKYFNEKTDKMAMCFFTEEKMVFVEHEIQFSSTMTEKEEVEFYTKNNHTVTEIDFSFSIDHLFFRKVESILSKKFKNLKGYFIQIIIKDTNERNIIASLIDIFINILNCKGIQILTYGFLVAMKLREPTLALKIKYTKNNMNKKDSNLSITDDNNTLISDNLNYVFVDDYTILESIEIPRKEKSLNTIFKHEINYDIADEINKLKSINYENTFTCRLCDFYEKEEEKIIKHIEKEHKIEETTVKENVVELKDRYDFIQLTNYLYCNKKKIHEKCFEIEICENDFERSKNVNEKLSGDTNKTMALNVGDLIYEAFTLRDLEISKELWIADKEWEIGRIRLLKEKVLFYI